MSSNALLDPKSVLNISIVENINPPEQMIKRHLLMKLHYQELRNTQSDVLVIVFPLWNWFHITLKLYVFTNFRFNLSRAPYFETDLSHERHFECICHYFHENGGLFFYRSFSFWPHKILNYELTVVQWLCTFCSYMNRESEK